MKNGTVSILSTHREGQPVQFTSAYNLNIFPLSFNLLGKIIDLCCFAFGFLFSLPVISL